MSRRTTIEYLSRMSHRYRCMRTRKARTKILTEFVEVTGYERKYALKLLRGTRKYREHPGRGRSYGQEDGKILYRIWLTFNQVSPRYLKVMLPEYIRSFERHKAVIPPEVKERLLRMSASTMDRLLRCRRIGGSPAFRRRGVSNPLKQQIACCAGHEPLAEYPPGHIQVDTVALCAGSIQGDFIWILNSTDLHTQWLECGAVWNRGAYNTFTCLKELERRTPFHWCHVHSDNGGEFINAHLHKYLTEHQPPCSFTRSRPRRPNDNAYVEQKNADIIRDRFGYDRLDNPAQQPPADKLCRLLSLYVNFFNPSMKLVAINQRTGKRTPAKVYDTPQTPAMRLLSHPETSQSTKQWIRQMQNSLDPIGLLQEMEAVMKKIYASPGIQKPLSPFRGG